MKRNAFNQYSTQRSPVVVTGGENNCNTIAGTGKNIRSNGLSMKRNMMVRVTDEDVSPSSSPTVAAVCVNNPTAAELTSSCSADRQ